MPIRVNIPNVGAVNFPDGMAPDDIHSTVDSIYSQSIAANPPGVPRPQVNMQPSFAGTLLGGQPSTPSMPTRGATLQAQQIEQHPALAEAAGVVGSAAIPALAGAAGFANPAVAGALTPIAKKYGIKALEGAGLGLGYDLYHELKKVFEP